MPETRSDAYLSEQRTSTSYTAPGSHSTSQLARQMGAASLGETGPGSPRSSAIDAAAELPISPASVGAVSDGGDSTAASPGLSLKSTAKSSTAGSTIVTESQGNAGTSGQTVETETEAEAGPKATGKAILSQYGHITHLPTGPHDRAMALYSAHVTEDPNDPASEESKAAALDFDITEMTGGTFSRTVPHLWQWPSDMDFENPLDYVRAVQMYQKAMSTHIPRHMEDMIRSYKLRRNLPDDAFGYSYDDEETFMNRHPHPSQSEELRGADIDWNKPLEPDWTKYKEDMSKLVGTEELNRKPTLYAMTVMTDGPAYTDNTYSSVIPPKSKLVTVVSDLPGYPASPESRALAEGFAGKLASAVDETAQRARLTSYSNETSPTQRLKNIFAGSYWDITKHTKLLMERLYDSSPEKERFKFVPISFWEYNEAFPNARVTSVQYGDYVSELQRIGGPLVRAPSADDQSRLLVDEPAHLEGVAPTG
ncbi:hypothetical protein I316_04336 [Kwoniella heveanensis BCC8398]|uniref:Uncharacterized protein n=1 Tax=Kwoniella heveanensis BCC8398 TaxID=1296120 RepID=A0A1B9GSE1_9TREE|nr:hypothetical protein I316_04336 [Kwoniella heveanensis BCC8398]